MKVIVIDQDEEFVLSFIEKLKIQMRELHLPLEQDVEILRSSQDFSMELLRGGTDTCVITEIQPPQIDGLGLAGEIRKRDDKTAIVICTETNDYGMQCYDLGITYYLLKPVTDQSIRMMIKRIVRTMREQETGF